MPGLSGAHAVSGSKARADIDPVAVDANVSWADVGGLETQVEVREGLLGN